MESEILKALIDELYEEGYITHKDYEKHIKDNNLFSITDDKLARAWNRAETLAKSTNIKHLQNSGIFDNVKYGDVIPTRELPLKTPVDVQGFIELWRLQNYARFWGNKYINIIGSQQPHVKDKTEEDSLDIAGFALADDHEVTKKFFWSTDMINEAYSMPMPEHHVTENLVDDENGYFFVFEKPVRLEGVDGIYHIRWISILKSKDGFIISHDVFEQLYADFKHNKLMVQDMRESQQNLNIPFGAEYPKNFWQEKNPNFGTLIMSLLNFLRSTATITKKGRSTRAEIRRAKKRGIKLQKKDTNVNVVYLRPTKYEYEKNDNEPTRKNKSYKGRFNVRGHWRNYWVGKGRNRRELRYIQGFQKGSGNLINKIHIVKN